MSEAQASAAVEMGPRLSPLVAHLTHRVSGDGTALRDAADAVALDWVPGQKRGFFPPRRAVTATCSKPPPTHRPLGMLAERRRTLVA